MWWLSACVFLLTKESFLHILTVLDEVIQLIQFNISNIKKVKRIRRLKTDSKERAGEYVIELDYRSNKPIYEQIIEQMKLHVIKGHLQPGDAIPSVRKLAQTLGVTPTTVAKAYQELERQRVIETIRAKGTFIAQNIQIRQDEDKVKDICSRLSSEILELKLMGYTAEQLQEMIHEIYQSI